MTGIGIAGTITTAVLAARGAQQAEYCLSTEDKKLPRTEQAKLVWRCYIPAAVSGAITIGCIYGAQHVNSRKAAALTAAYSLSDRAFAEYKEKVQEHLTPTKAGEIQAELAKDKVEKHPNTSSIVIEGTDALCCELHTMRYFKSDMESLRKAQNDINSKILKHDSAYLADFYDLVGIPNTTHSWEMGWDTNRPMELEISAILADNGKPCLAFEYNYVKVL
jgi:hypothetical protein